MLYFFTWNAAVEIHSQWNVTIPRDRKNTNIPGNDWRVRKNVTYHRMRVGVAKEYLLIWEIQKKHKRLRFLMETQDAVW